MYVFMYHSLLCRFYLQAEHLGLLYALRVLYMVSVEMCSVHHHAWTSYMWLFHHIYRLQSIVAMALRFIYHSYMFSDINVCIHIGINCYSRSATPKFPFGAQKKSCQSLSMVVVIYSVCFQRRKCFLCL